MMHTITSVEFDAGSWICVVTASTGKSMTMNLKTRSGVMAFAALCSLCGLEDVPGDTDDLLGRRMR